jgi:alpha-glucosidase
MRIPHADPGAASFSWLTGGEGTLATLDEFQPWIDLSVDMGWEYVLADAGWPAMKDEAGDPVTLEELAQRVSDQGAELWVWINSGGPNNNHPGQPQDVIVERDERRAYFERLHDAGVRGVKVDIWESDKQGIIAQQRAVLQDAADFELMVTFHNTTIPRGWERELPHLLSVEAAIRRHLREGPRRPQRPVAGAQHNPAVHSACGGGFDYSPTTLNTDVSPASERRSTAAHQLALAAILMQSGMLTYGGAPEGYLDRPDKVREYLRQVPGHYDEVAYLGGRPGDSVVIGRRSGDTWYVAAVNGKTTYVSPVSDPTQPGYQPPVGCRRR